MTPLGPAGTPVDTLEQRLVRRMVHEELTVLAARLRQHAVWRHIEDRPSDTNHEGPDITGKPPPEPPPRLIAVVKNQREFERLRAHAEDIRAEFRAAFNHDPRRLPTFFDEVWERAALRINTAYSSQYIPPGQPVGEILDQPEGYLEMTPEQRAAAIVDLPQYRHLVAVLGPLAQLGARADGVAIRITSPVGGITVREHTGRAFRLFGWPERDSSGVLPEPRKNIKLGAVVLRGLASEVVEIQLPRRQRADRLVPIGVYGGWELALPAQAVVGN